MAKEKQNLCPRSVEIYDTTLRDGAQAAEIAFSVIDKIRIAERLAEIGIHYIEGGWPGANPRDDEFFRKMRSRKLGRTRLVAFGSTVNPKRKPESDPAVQALLRAGTGAVTIVGKSWDLHLKKALRIGLERNLEIIGSTLSYLRPRVDRLFFDAEHFFDGCRENPDYALETIRAAAGAGADAVVLCDTNGGTLPFELSEIFARARAGISAPLGIHTHNDSELAVANTLAAVRLGAVQVQGTINGIGERCGNANLISIIPALKLKLGVDCVSDRALTRLFEVSHFVDEILNQVPNRHQPYVGTNAFAHKGGMHISAVERHSPTYEHVDPGMIGNRRKVLVSDQSGRSTVVAKAREYGIRLKADDPRTGELLRELKELEKEGFQFEGAEGSFELILRRAIEGKKKYFRLHGFRVINEKRTENEPVISEATIMVDVNGKVEHTAALGNGPVNALDNALRKALEKFYPPLSEIRLEDYKVRVLSEQEGTAAPVRVLIESSDGRKNWGTVGVSRNIIEASWQALVDSLEFKLRSVSGKGKNRRKKKG